MKFWKFVWLMLVRIRWFGGVSVGVVCVKNLLKFFLLWLYCGKCWEEDMKFCLFFWCVFSLYLFFVCFRIFVYFLWFWYFF